MNKLLKILEQNPKIGKIETYLKPSLEDKLVYKRISIVVIKNRDYTNFSKLIDITPSDDKDYFCVSFYTSIDPSTSLLSDIYSKHASFLWGSRRMYHKLFLVEFDIKYEDIHKIINYIYSCSN